MSEYEKQEAGDKAPVKKKKRWLKVLLYMFGAFIILLAIAYFYISSAAFIRGQVFTRVQDTLNQPIEAQDISFSPFSSFEFKDFKLGDDPFIKAGRVKVAYELMPMLSKNINVSELSVEDAEINVIVNRDGKLNILSKMIEEIKEEKKEDKKEEKKEDKKEEKSDAPK